VLHYSTRSYVEKKITAERNLRLREGKGYMSKAELRTLRKKLKSEAAAKYHQDVR
jgi:hypothetical protein